MPKRSTSATTAPVVDDEVPAAKPAAPPKKDDTVRVVSCEAEGNFSASFTLSDKTKGNGHHERDDAPT